MFASKLAILLSVLLLSAPALAENRALKTAEKIAVGKWMPVKGMTYAVGAGWESVDMVSLSGALGYVWGRMKTGLLGAASVNHISLAPRLRTVTSETDVGVDVAVLVGHSWRALAYFGVEGGIDLRLTDTLLVGPMVKLRVGYRSYGTYLYTAALFGDDDQVVVGLGVEYFSLPALSVVESLKRSLQ
jgi:hypothetical protein